ncbi:hypothetical protein R6Q59_020132 [Mikania micrantha]
MNLEGTQNLHKDLCTSCKDVLVAGIESRIYACTFLPAEIEEVMQKVGETIFPQLEVMLYLLTNEHN